MKRKRLAIPLFLLTVAALLLTSCGVIFVPADQPVTPGTGGVESTDERIIEVPDPEDPPIPDAGTDGLEFTIQGDGSYAVTGIGTAGDRIIIPAVYQGAPVTKIGWSAFKYLDTLVSVEIPDSVHTIGDYAFTGCTSLTHVSFGAGVGYIGYEAFAGCNALAELSLPASVKIIFSTSFLYCFNLESISVAEGCSKYYSAGNCLIETESQTLLLGCKNSTIPEGVISISDAFAYCEDLTEIVIPSSVTHVGTGSFSTCTGVERITVADGNPKYHSAGNCLIETGSKTLILGCKNSVIPDDGSVTVIGEEAFFTCVGLTSIRIPDYVTCIEGAAFYECTGLTTVSIGKGLTDIAEGAFYHTPALASLTVAEGNQTYHSAGNCVIETAEKRLVVGCKSSIIPADGSVTTIAPFSFYGSGVEHISIPEGVVSIESSAFAWSEQLKTVTFSDSVKNIGDFAFSSCSALTSVNIPDGITRIENFAFSYCTYLSNVSLPESVTEIGESAFIRCRALKTLTIPESVTDIDMRAFAECSGLTELIIPDHVSRIDSMAFYQCTSLTRLSIGTGVTTWGSAVFAECTGLTDVSLPNTLTELASQMFYGCTSLQAITLPDSLVRIGSYALYRCTGLTDLTIPDSVTGIEGSAFGCCTGLTGITFPASVTAIGYGVLEGCSGLESISVAEGSTSYSGTGNCLIARKSKSLLAGCKNSIIPADGSVTSINNCAFSGCRGVSEIVIPEGITSTGLGTFQNCIDMKSITIPLSLKRIGSGMFMDCTNLVEICYNGTKAEWNAIEKFSKWDYNTGDYTVYCTDGDIVKGMEDQ